MGGDSQAPGGMGRGKTVLCWLALASLSLVAAWPGLVGSWIYDDWGMLGNPLYDEPGDVLAVLGQTSGDYFDARPGHSGPPTGGGGAYRPLTMATLVAVHALAPSPLPHHVLGWALHLLVAVLLWRALRGAGDDGLASGVAWAAAALFLLHPVGVEAYVWINGRSDLVAAIFAAWMLKRAMDGAAPLGWPTLLLMLAGGFSKETFVPIGVALSACHSAALHRQGRLRAWLPFAAGVVGALGVAATRMSLAAASGNTFAGGKGVLTDPTTWAFLPRLLAEGMYAIVSMRAAVMQSLAWMRFSEGEPAVWAVLGASVLGAALLVWARDLPGLLRLGGAAACLAPTVVVSRALWFGFDRYLYMPLLVVLSVAAPHAVRGLRRAPALVRPAAGAALLLILVAAASTRVAALAYQGEGAWATALLRERPEDPTVLVFVARGADKQGNAQGVRAYMAAMPQPPWPPAVYMPVLLLAEKYRDQRLLDATVQSALQQTPDEPLVRAHGMRWHFRAGRLQDALQLASSLRGDEPLCPEVRRQLSVWRRQSRDPTQAARLADALQAHACD